MFGGRQSDGYTWEWDGLQWTQASTNGQVPANGNPEMVYDSHRQRMVLFGGYPSAAQTWEYREARLAKYTSFGAGCASTTTPTALSATTPPKINTTFTLRVSNLGPFSPGILLFGFSNSTWGGVPLPLDLNFLGMSGCNLLVSWDLQVGFFPSGGKWDLPLPLPNDPTLAGLTFYNQAWVLDPQANAFGVGTSNGGKGVIGY
jgi:hypothetical protein